MRIEREKPKVTTNCAHLVTRGAKPTTGNLRPFLFNPFTIDVSAQTRNHLYMINQNSREIETSWIEALALEELTMEESGYINFSESNEVEKVIERSSLEFISRLKDYFEFCVSQFNQYRLQHERGQAIKIFRIANTENDFMLFRNSLKLIVARKATDVISVGFLSNSGNIFSPRVPGDLSQNAIHEIKAHIGPFNSVTWRYQGEIVEEKALVRYYLAEFIRNSCR